MFSAATQVVKAAQLVKIILVAIPVEAVVKVIQLVKIPLVATPAEAATPVARKVQLVKTI